MIKYSKSFKNTLSNQLWQMLLCYWFKKISGFKQNFVIAGMEQPNSRRRQLYSCIWKLRKTRVFKISYARTRLKAKNDTTTFLRCQVWLRVQNIYDRLIPATLSQCSNLSGNFPGHRVSVVISWQTHVAKLLFSSNYLPSRFTRFSNNFFHYRKMQAVFDNVMSSP